MISERLARLLIEQVGHELRAHQVYLGIGLYFERQSLSRWAKLFNDQSVEEAGHATKIMEFLSDNSVTYDLPALKSATTRYSSAAHAAQTALESEQRVSAQFQEMAKSALAEGDHTSYQFLMWFVSEQVEEERKIQGLVDLIDSGVNLFQAEALLDQFE
jgi:ferritin